MDWRRVSSFIAAAGAAVAAVASVGASRAAVQSSPPRPAPQEYEALKAFALTGEGINVDHLTFVRDRVTMSFSGTFWLMAPVAGHVTGAVFIGEGAVHAEVPSTPANFEKENVRRLLGADVVESDFRTAVIRMTDDTSDVILRARTPEPPVRTLGSSAPSPPAVKLAADFEPRLLEETGINLSARLALSLQNGEQPGVFVAEFDGGRRGRFDLALDYQTRIPTTAFGIDGGEKGVFWQYMPSIYFAQVWMAFYAEAEYGHVVAYSDTQNLVDITHYTLDLDLTNPSARLGLVATMDMTATAPTVRAINFRVGEELGSFEDERLKRQLRVKSARLGATPIPVVQEDWEGGFTLFLPAAVHGGDRLTVTVTLDGSFLRSLTDDFYPLSNDSWLPRHGDLDRATFDMTYRHLKRHRIASSGQRVSEQPDPASADLMVTRYRLDVPVPLVTFAVGQFDRSQMTADWVKGGAPITVEFNNVSNHVAQIRGDFMLAEMDNAVRFFAAIFGPYPYPVLNGCVHPYTFGQGFATLLMLAPADRADFNTFSFIAHETSHQWWGNLVSWRSYRDQWLSEGFADYSGMLYATEREKQGSGGAAALALRDQALAIHADREALLRPPTSTVGLAKGRLVDMGPIILGQRLSTTRSGGAYTALIYKKGALVLRMLQFLLSDPTTTDQAGSEFFPMMRAFVARYHDKAASTDNFQDVASEFFAKTPVAAKYTIPNLDWFFNQWVYQSGLPSYTLDYETKDQSDGSCLLTGTLHQDNVPDSWIMPLPVVITLGGGRTARTVVLASGAATPFQLKAPGHPLRVELDPDNWVLSEKTITRGR